jgi:hypothetical protein
MRDGKTWEFSATLEENGEILLEWYHDRHNVVTVALDNTGACDNINWAIMLDSKPYTGSVSGVLKVDQD